MTTDRKARAGMTLTSAALGLTALAVPSWAAPSEGRAEWSITRDTPANHNGTISRTGSGWRLSPGEHGRLSASTDDRTGTLTFAPRKLRHEVNTIAAAVDGTLPEGSSAAVDLRGKRADGSWSQWTEARQGRPAALAEDTRSVQARLVMSAPPDTASPVVRGIELTGYDAAAPATQEIAGDGDTYRVFATREGLVGGTTANGHVIVKRDHFAALPSRRGLADKDDGSYTVQVCTEDGSRCAWVPVWDVGPWNTKDDYWTDDRERWQDLPKGKPQAQAAYQDGYNGGKDQFGRKVANPAGIDLADGTFWDGLGFDGNGWVEVTYEWTGKGPWGTITTNGPVLNVRAEPAGKAAQAGLAAKHAQVRIDCVARGEKVDGTQGSTDDWLQLADSKYVSAAYVEVGHAPPPC